MNGWSLRATKMRPDDSWRSYLSVEMVLQASYRPKREWADWPAQAVVRQEDLARQLEHHEDLVVLDHHRPGAVGDLVAALGLAVEGALQGGLEGAQVQAGQAALLGLARDRRGQRLRLGRGQLMG